MNHQRGRNSVAERGCADSAVRTAILRAYDDVGDGGEFGVTLIERGHEVGEDDTRFGVGCATRIVASARQDFDSIVAIIAGTQRIRVTEWLRDVPYPWARIEHFGDGPPTDETPALLGECTSAFRTVRALLSELRSDVGEPQLSPDPGVATYQIAHVTPLQELDRQRLLECVDPDERASLLHDYHPTSKRCSRRASVVLAVSESGEVSPHHESLPNTPIEAPPHVNREVSRSSGGKPAAANPDAAPGSKNER